MNRWMNYWNDFWFQETSTIPLAVCRIVAVGTQLLLFLPSLGVQINLLEGGAGFTEPQLLIVGLAKILPADVFLTSSAFTTIYWVTVVTGITALIGLGSRTSAFVFALGNWILVAHTYSYGEEHHPEALFCIFLLLLAFSPSGQRLSVDACLRRWRSRFKKEKYQVPEKSETAIWPLKFIFVLLAITYCSTGLTKMVYGGLAWMNGYTMQQILLTQGIQRDIPLGIWLSQQHNLCILLSVFTIIFELFFFVALFVSSLVPYFLAMGIVFHVGLYLTGRHDFFQHIVLLTLLLVFHNTARWTIWPERREGTLAIGSSQTSSAGAMHSGH